MTRSLSRSGQIIVAVLVACTVIPVAVVLAVFWLDLSPFVGLLLGLGSMGVVYLVDAVASIGEGETLHTCPYGCEDEV